MKTESRNQWYERIPSRERAVLDAMANWLRPIQWQLFATLTFPWNVSSETADKKFNSFINELERELKTRICHVEGKENVTKFGAPVPWHFHVCLTSLEVIPAKSIVDKWATLVHRVGDKTTDIVLVEVYNPKLKGLEYIAKMNGSHAASWNLNWIPLFLPDTPSPFGTGLKRIRRQDRWLQQVQNSKALTLESAAR